MRRVVNSLADPGDGTCDARQCTLREAIEASGTTSIAFAPGLTGTITLASPADRGGALRINTALTITGPSSRITIRRRSTDPAFRILRVDTSATVTLTNLTIRNGRTDRQGGGILNRGRLTLCRLHGRRQCSRTIGRRDRERGPPHAHPQHCLRQRRFRHHEPGREAGGDRQPDRAQHWDRHRQWRCTRHHQYHSQRQRGPRHLRGLEHCHPGSGQDYGQLRRWLLRVSGHRKDVTKHRRPKHRAARCRDPRVARRRDHHHEEYRGR